MLDRPASLFLAIAAARSDAGYNDDVAGAGAGWKSMLNAYFSDAVLLPALEIGTACHFWIAVGNASLCAAMLKDFVVYVVVSHIDPRVMRSGSSPSSACVVVHGARQPDGGIRWFINTVVSEVMETAHTSRTYI